MINTSEDFSRTYSSFLASHNYRGLVDLLSSSTFDVDDESRGMINNLINKFREQADIEDKLLEGVDDKVKKSYYFVTSGPNKTDWTDENGNVDKSLPSYKFAQAWNSLANEDNIINIKFNNESEFNNFVSSLGGNYIDIRNMGITLGKNYNVSFPTDINDKMSVYKAITSSKMLDNLKDKMAEARRAETNAYFTPGSDLYKYTKEKRDAEREYYSDFAYKLKVMQDAVEEANVDYNNLIKQKNFKPYITEMIVSGYMGEDDRKLQQSFSAGLIDLEDFKEMRSILEEKYTRVLQTKSLSQYDVWAMNEDNKGSQVLEPLNDNIRKNNLDAEINQAIADGRLHFSHATNGSDIGTMLVIDAKLDKDGKPVNGSKPLRLFVKDLFKSKAEDNLRKDTKTAAQMEYAKHQTYRHIYRLSDGGTISDWNQDADVAVYKNKNGVEQPVDKAQILELIDNDIIAKRAIDYYNAANKRDSKGNGYTAEYYKVYANKGFNSKDLYDNIASSALAAMSKQYEGQSEDFIKYKAQELLATILKGIGANFDDDLDSSTGVQALNELLTRRTGN